MTMPPGIEYPRSSVRQPRRGRETMSSSKRFTRIKPDEKVPVVLSVQEKQLIVEYSFLEPEYARRLRRFEDDTVRGTFTLGDLDDLRGYIAAGANHTKDTKLEKRLDALWAKLTAIMESYDDGGWS